MYLNVLSEYISFFFLFLDFHRLYNEDSCMFVSISDVQIVASELQVLAYFTVTQTCLRGPRNV